MIVTSAVYRQASAANASGAAKDAGNALLWRMNRRRLDAESTRDTVLWASGRLKQQMFGPSFQAFVIVKPEHSPHYEYDRSDPDDARTQRRTVYRFLVRSQPDPFLQTLDCADPSQIVDKRDESITALQALALLNDRFLLRMAEHTSQRIRAAASDPERQVAAAIRLDARTSRRPRPNRGNSSSSRGSSASRRRAGCYSISTSLCLSTEVHQETAACVKSAGKHRTVPSTAANSCGRAEAGWAESPWRACWRKPVRAASKSSRVPRRRAGGAAAQSSGQGEGRGAALHGGRGQPCRYVRSQAPAVEAKRPEMGSRREGRTFPGRLGPPFALLGNGPVMAKAARL